MHERDLQAYLFENPNILFPGQRIEEKTREFYIEGRRIDLLFRVDGIRHIVELKAVPLKREHVGQVVEYYGLLRKSLESHRIKMVLVAPSIPEFRRTFLEELGIRCVEIAEVPKTPSEIQRLREDATEHRKNEEIENTLSAGFERFNLIRFEDVTPPVTRASVAATHAILKDTLPAIRRAFDGYDVLPAKIMRADSADTICSGIPGDDGAIPPFSSGGAWWAYSFGHTEEMPKNDVPNISACGMPWGFDLTINAELRTSQSVMRNKIFRNPSAFDKLIQDHGALQFQALLKLEHQPRFYHWIPLAFYGPSHWSSKTVLELYSKTESEYTLLRNHWLMAIDQVRQNLSAAQLDHMRKRNKQLNLAFRFVRPFTKKDPLWSLPYANQCEAFVSECTRLKPLIDFFQ